MDNNKKHRLHLTNLLLISLWFFATCATCETTIAELIELQQNTLLTNAQIELFKRKKEFADIESKCANLTEHYEQVHKGFGKLYLKAICGIQKRYFAIFRYNNIVQIEAVEGDELLHGEKVIKIESNLVKIEKNGKYHYLKPLIIPTTPHAKLIQPVVSYLTQAP